MKENSSLFSCNGNPVLWCKIKDGLDRLCDDVASGMSTFSKVDGPEYIDYFLHLDDAFAAVAGHPAGNTMEFHTGDDLNCYVIEDYDTPRIAGEHDWLGTGPWRVAWNILDSAPFFGIEGTESPDKWNNPDFASWAACLRRAVPRIVTWRWPDWFLAIASGIVTNDHVIVDPDTHKTWDYFRAAQYFWDKIEQPRARIIKVFFGRVIYRHGGSGSEVHVFKPDATEGLTWARFMDQIDNFSDFTKDNYVNLGYIRWNTLWDYVRNTFPDSDRSDLTCG